MFRVVWEIEIDAETAVLAARKALAIHRNPESIATVFDITDENGQTVRVDLGERDQEDGTHVRVRRLWQNLRGSPILTA